MSVTVGSPAPSITLPDQNGVEHHLPLESKWSVLYFYPKDNTPGCTTEACDFRDNHSLLQQMGADVMGVSPDSPKSHTGFVKKFELPFTLLADENHELAEAYGVWVEKSMYGKKYMGVERSTFIIDPNGIIRKEWRKVSVTGHVTEVAAALKELQG
ncbi:MAG: thioredoxin-dependent thiol peroxidase [Armatimonadota bacterium]